MSELKKVSELLKENEQYRDTISPYALSVDMRREKPFHCAVCGFTYEACAHWTAETLEGEE